ncbi:MAG: aldo/keto reductase [Asgard group archaeon]|nr:aldo/keto reductase [Asgard group archaeon]
MEYRKFGKLDWKASALGFGCMRLPIIDDDYTKINEKEATKMIHTANDNGVNYIDTAYNFNQSNSESFLGRALKNGYREKVKLATKMLPLEIKKYEDFDILLNKQLDKLQTDFVDFYLLHGLNRRWFPKLRDLDVFKWAEGAINDGRIRHLGFSFHDEFNVLQKIVETFDWTFCQILYNYMSLDYQAGFKGLKYLAEKELAVVIMSPLLGSWLANAPKQVEEIWNSAQIKRSPAEWGLQWLWNQSEISVVLSGMSTMDQVLDNIKGASRSGISKFSKEELMLVDKVREIYHELRAVPCTGCGYCMDCPNGVDIPYNFKLLNEGKMYENFARARSWYRFMENGLEGDYHREKGQAVLCTQCQECESKCPHSIAISEWMAIVHQVLGEGKFFDDFPKPKQITSKI